MFYREAGQYKTSYAADQAIFPLRQDRIGLAVLLVFAVVGVPLLASDYIISSVLLPFLILSIGALGLNLLVGYCGLISLGGAGFMAVGAFAAYKITTGFTWLPEIVVFLLAGVVTALVGLLFGLPSLRIKGFYLAVTTLAAHFFIEWTVTHFGWFSNYSTSGVISAPSLTFFGLAVHSPQARYLYVLGWALALGLLAKNMVRSQLGRSWMAVRDMDVAAAVIGIPVLKTKLLAFALSAFYCGIAGALYVFVFLGTVEPQAFDLNLAFSLLFMVIIGGLGSIMGSYFGAAFIVILPVAITNVGGLFGTVMPAEVVSNSELIVFGSLIVFFLIVEPLGLARLWSLGKEKLRTWPFPY